MRARLNDVEIAYSDQGQGMPILWVHGYPLGQAMWADQVEALSPQFRVLTVDLRGHGDSEAPPWLSTLDVFADDLRALLDHRSIDRVVLAGFSMGGYIAFSFYRKFKDRVRALILVDTRAQADTDPARQARFQAARTAHHEGAWAIAEAMIPKLLSPQSVQGRPELVERVRRIMMRTPAAGIVADLMAMAERADSTPLLSQIDCPTLVVVGEQDVLTPPAEAQRIAETIKQARLDVIPGAGHLSSMEQPEHFNKAVRKFLETL